MRARGQGDEAEHRLRAQIKCLLRALFTSRHRLRLAILAVALLIVVLSNTFGQIKLNAWHGTFYDALEQRSLSALGDQVILFLIITGGLLSLVVAQNWLQEVLKIRLREWLTHDLVDEWLGPKRAYFLAHAGEVGANPDQYIQADARNLAEMSAGLTFGLLQSSLLLVSFIGVLWILSSQVVFTYGDQSFTIPGYMVWCALAYALAGSALTWLVGRPLIKMNAERYAREADLRFAIVHVNESVEAVALERGEVNERRLVNTPIANMVKIGCKLAKGHAKLTWITSGYGWLAIIVPVLVAAPGFFGGSLSLGGLMMVAGAFHQVQNSLRWFVDNFAGIAEWRATLLRVAGFRNRLRNLGKPFPDTPHRIAVDCHPQGLLRFEDVSVLLPDGHGILDTRFAEVGSGERVLISGPAGSGKSQILRAVAGLWSSGSGIILLPPAKDIMFVPPRPYLPLGSLRDAITYPRDTGRFDDPAMRTALLRAGLSSLIDRLDENERWDKILSVGEQRRLVFTRLLIHMPRWVFLEDAMATMDAEDCELMLSIFEQELSASAVIGIGSAPALDGFYHRTLRLNRIVDDLSARQQQREDHWPLQTLQAAE